MAEIIIHRAHLEISHEMPVNSLSMEVRVSDGTRLRFYFRDLEQWWAIRSTLPKWADYYLSTASDDERFIGDHAKADAWARDFYEREKAKLLAAASEPVEFPAVEEEIVF